MISTIDNYSSVEISDNPIVSITIDGQDYKSPYSNLMALDYVDNLLVNTSNTSFYLNSSYQVSGNNNRAVPYIYCPASQACRYYSSYSSYALVSSDFNYQGNFKYDLYHNPIYMLIIAVFAIFFLILQKK